MKVPNFAYMHTYLLSLTGVLKDLKRDRFCKPQVTKGHPRWWDVNSY